MTRKARITYLATTLSVFATGFIIYGWLGSLEPLINNNKIISFLCFGALGGFGFSILLSTVILVARFFAKKELWFKIIAALLWPITFAVSVYVGVFSYIPYQIYNIVKIIKDRPETD